MLLCTPHGQQTIYRHQQSLQPDVKFTKLTCVVPPTDGSASVQLSAPILVMLLPQGELLSLVITMAAAKQIQVDDRVLTSCTVGDGLCHSMSDQSSMMLSRGLVEPMLLVTI